MGKNRPKHESDLGTWVSLISYQALREIGAGKSTITFNRVEGFIPRRMRRFDLIFVFDTLWDCPEVVHCGMKFAVTLT